MKYRGRTISRALKNKIVSLLFKGRERLTDIVSPPLSNLAANPSSTSPSTSPAKTTTPIPPLPTPPSSNGQTNGSSLRNCTLPQKPAQHPSASPRWTWKPSRSSENGNTQLPSRRAISPRTSSSNHAIRCQVYWGRHPSRTSSSWKP